MVYSSNLSSLYSEYLLLSKTYNQAIEEYNIENQTNLNRNVLFNLNNKEQKTFYVGKYNDLSTIYNTSQIIKSIDIYDNLVITLYKEKNFTGQSKTYMNTKKNNYSSQLINTTYKSLKVELIDKKYDLYPSKKFNTESTPIVNNILNQTECANLCINNINCNASVFNSSLNTCSVFKTPGILKEGTPQDKTIIPINKRKLLIITELNTKLKAIIEQIQTDTTIVLQENELSLEQKQIGLNEYNKKKQNIKQLQAYLKQQQEEYKSLEAELTNSSTSIMSYVNTYYLMWLLLIYLIILIFKNIFIPNVTTSTNTWVILTICIILASYNIHNINGYLLWCILVLIFILKIILPRL